ncbi:hypothetical protein BDQ17DRAFT_1062167 [Cyathus striatus]|nr:hypothetical protein BDQ17DRAFT_1062167 [Cyathus striatus]
MCGLICLVLSLLFLGLLNSVNLIDLVLLVSLRGDATVSVIPSVVRQDVNPLARSKHYTAHAVSGIFGFQSHVSIEYST